MGRSVTNSDGVTTFYDDSGNIVGYHRDNETVVEAYGDYMPLASVVQGAASGDSGWLDTFNNLVAQVPQIITGVTAYQLSQINMERAKRGQSPLNAAAYGPQVGVGLNQQTMQYLMYGAFGIAAVYLIGQRRK